MDHMLEMLSQRELGVLLDNLKQFTEINDDLDLPLIVPNPKGHLSGTGIQVN